MKDNTEDKLLKSVMEKIEKDKISIKPRIYFVMGSVLFGIILAILMPLAIFSFSVTFFQLRVFGGFGWLDFGLLGIKPFLLLFPWVAFLLALISLGGIIKILTRYDVSYKWNFIAITLILLTFVITSAWIFDTTNLSERAKANKYASSIYPKHEKEENFLLGKVENIEGERILVKTLSGEDRILHFGCNEPNRCGVENIAEGDKIRVLMDGSNTKKPHILKMRKFQNRDF